jgi:hypothetical protein
MNAVANRVHVPLRHVLFDARDGHYCSIRIHVEKCPLRTIGQRFEANE